jgi:hypothetical protein
MENVVKEGLANLWKGKEAVGGKLYLTEQSLVHKGHKMNIQGGNVEINLKDIDHLEFYTNKLFGLSIINNGLMVVDKSGKEFKFVVNKRDNWKEEIERLLKN